MSALHFIQLTWAALYLKMDKLEKYIKAQHERGVKHSDLKKFLHKRGFHKDDVERAVTRVHAHSLLTEGEKDVHHILYYLVLKGSIFEFLFLIVLLSVVVLSGGVFGGSSGLSYLFIFITSICLGWLACLSIRKTTKEGRLIAEAGLVIPLLGILISYIIWEVASRFAQVSDPIGRTTWGLFNTTVNPVIGGILLYAGFNVFFFYTLLRRGDNKSLSYFMLLPVILFLMLGIAYLIINIVIRRTI